MMTRPTPGSDDDTLETGILDGGDAGRGLDHGGRFGKARRGAVVVASLLAGMPLPAGRRAAVVAFAMLSAPTRLPTLCHRLGGAGA